MLIACGLSILAMALAAWNGPVWQPVSFGAMDGALGCLIYWLRKRRGLAIECCVPGVPCPPPSGQKEDLLLAA